MSVSEQEAKQQIAQMRHALVSMKASARRASYVRIIGVIIGFGIVGIYVYLFISLGAAVAGSNRFRPLVEERLKTLDVQRKAVQVVEKAVPIYLEEGKKMLSTMDLSPVQKEAMALAEDLRPVMLAEMDRVWPKLQDALIVEGNQAAQQLETNLQTVLDTRLQAIVNKHSTQIQSETGLSEAQTAQVMTNIVDAGQQAVLSMVEKRWGENQKVLEAIAALVDKLPALPPMPESELLEHMRDTLIALVKYKLPDYDLEAAIGQSLQANAMAPVRPVQSAQSLQAQIMALEEQLKKPDLPAEAREGLQKTLDAAKKRQAAAPAAGPGESTENLQAQIKALEEQLKKPDLPAEAREGLQKTLDAAKQRLNEK